MLLDLCPSEEKGAQSKPELNKAFVSFVCCLGNRETERSGKKGTFEIVYFWNGVAPRLDPPTQTPTQKPICKYTVVMR